MSVAQDWLTVKELRCMTSMSHGIEVFLLLSIHAMVSVCASQFEPAAFDELLPVNEDLNIYLLDAALNESTASAYFNGQLYHDDLGVLSSTSDCYIEWTAGLFQKLSSRVSETQILHFLQFFTAKKTVRLQWELEHK